MNKEEIIKRKCELLAETLIKKDADYGSSFDKTLDEYGNTVGLIRIEDKLNRAKNILLNKKQTQVDESITDTILDIAGYSILFNIYLERKENE